MNAGLAGEPTMSSEGLGRFRSVRSPSLVLPPKWEMRHEATEGAAPISTLIGGWETASIFGRVHPLNLSGDGVGASGCRDGARWERKGFSKGGRLLGLLSPA